MTNSGGRFRKRKDKIVNRVALILWGMVGLYLLAYLVDSALGGYWLIPARDGRDHFLPELGGLSITDAIIWQPRFGHCELGHTDRAGLFFLPLFQIDQKWFHATHYLVDENYEKWIQGLPRSKVHPRFREVFDEYNRTNRAGSGKAAMTSDNIMW
jgi:hypothetical protein